jgi:hypothetical protein
LRGVIINDNYVFPQGLCSQANHANLVGFEGYAYAITHNGQIHGFKSETAGSIEMFPVSVTSMDTTGVFADLANIQTDTLTVKYGELKPFVNRRTVAQITFTERDLVQPVALKLQGTIQNLSILDACMDVPVNPDVANLSVETAQVNGATATAGAITKNGLNYTVVLTPTPTAGQNVTLQLKWKEGQITNGISNLHTYTAG